MQRIIALTFAAWLSLPAALEAQDQQPHAAHGPKEHPGGAAQHVERAGTELKEAGKAATEQARDAVREASDQAGETLREAREGAGVALDQARKQAASSANEAEVALKQAGEQASSKVEQARVKAASLFAEARSHLRRVLLHAAGSLDMKQRPEEKDKALDQRKEASRAEQWRALREQLQALEQLHDDPQSGQVRPALSEELRLHAQRTARLARIRALADRAKDSESVKRCDALLTKELTRHEQRLNAVLNQREANEGGRKP